MRKFITLLLICFSFISIQFTYATSGRTNSSGCHNSKKVGYHCHGAPKKSSYISKGTTYTSKNNKKTRNIVSKVKISNNVSSEKINDEIDSLVYGIQVQLNALGYIVGKIDGVFGEKTKSAIKLFQKSTKIVVDGKPTTDLLVKLVLANSKPH